MSETIYSTITITHTKAEKVASQQSIKNDLEHEVNAYFSTKVTTTTNDCCTVGFALVGINSGEKNGSSGKTTQDSCIDWTQFAISRDLQESGIFIPFVTPIILEDAKTSDCVLNCSQLEDAFISTIYHTECYQY